MKTLLVPTDFSEGAFNAAIHALHIARKLEAKLLFVHAYLMPPTGTAVMVDITEMLRLNAEQGLEQLQKRIEKLDLSKGVSTKFVAKHGTVSDVLQRAVEKENVALVIMGTQGASGITEKFLGSNAAAATRQLKCPVMAVPAEKPFLGLEKIVIATDMKQLNHAAIFETVKILALSFGSLVRFLHVRRIDEPFDHAASESFKQQVFQIFNDHNPLFTFIFENDIEDGLSEALEKDGSNLLVVIRRERGFFQSLFHSSISQRLVNEAALPVLVLKD